MSFTTSDLCCELASTPARLRLGRPHAMAGCDALLMLGTDFRYGSALVEVMTARPELAVPPRITLDQIKNSTLDATRSVISGRGDELIDLASTNVSRSPP